MHNSLRETIETEVQTHVEDFGDLIVQNIALEILVPAANLPQVLPFNTVVARHDVMGDVDRYGADEGVLLAQKLRSLTVALQGTYTEEANVSFIYRFGFNGGIDTTLETDVDEGFGPNSNRRVSNDIDNDVLYQTTGKATAGFKDQSNSTAAAPESFIMSDETNYLTEVGVLPEVSLRETLFQTLSVRSVSDADPQDGTLRLYASWQLYWLETDDEVEGRQIDLLED
jgi:hypothetical protein